MKIFLKSYLNCNLGDDLFIKIFLERYNNNKIYTVGAFRDNKLRKYGKVKIINRKIIKLIKMITRKKLDVNNFYMKKSDILLYLGGSIFKEQNGLNFTKNKLSKNFIIGANYGPYNTDNYYFECYNYFSNFDDICFRDYYSYNLFNHLKNVRVAKDIVFSLDTTKFSTIEEKRVIISVIDISKHFDALKLKIYIEKIRDLIVFFNKKKYDVCLMSFCKAEGDENIIKKIMKKVKNIDVSIYKYHGNIEKSIRFLSSASIIVGSRFHANVLGLVMNKTIIPIAYSNKTINMLKDIKFKGKIIDIKNIDEFDVNSLTDKDLEYKINVDKYRKDAEKHFERLDQVLERR